MAPCYSPRDDALEGASDMKPGRIVGGTVAQVRDTVIIVEIPTATGLIKGHLTFPHLSDNQGRNTLCP